MVAQNNMRMCVVKQVLYEKFKKYWLTAVNVNKYLKLPISLDTCASCSGLLSYKLSLYKPSNPVLKCILIQYVKYHFYPQVYPRSSERLFQRERSTHNYLRGVKPSESVSTDQPLPAPAPRPKGAYMEGTSSSQIRANSVEKEYPAIRALDTKRRSFRKPSDASKPKELDAKTEVEKLKGGVTKTALNDATASSDAKINALTQSIDRLKDLFGRKKSSSKDEIFNNAPNKENIFSDAPNKSDTYINAPKRDSLFAPIRDSSLESLDNAPNSFLKIQHTDYDTSKKDQDTNKSRIPQSPSFARKTSFTLPQSNGKSGTSVLQRPPSFSSLESIDNASNSPFSTFNDTSKKDSDRSKCRIPQSPSFARKMSTTGKSGSSVLQRQSSFGSLESLDNALNSPFKTNYDTSKKDSDRSKCRIPQSPSFARKTSFTLPQPTTTDSVDSHNRNGYERPGKDLDDGFDDEKEDTFSNYKSNTFDKPKANLALKSLRNTLNNRNVVAEIDTPSKRRSLHSDNRHSFDNPDSSEEGPDSPPPMTYGRGSTYDKLKNGLSRKNSRNYDTADEVEGSSTLGRNRVPQSPSLTRKTSFTLPRSAGKSEPVLQRQPSFSKNGQSLNRNPSFGKGGIKASGSFSKSDRDQPKSEKGLQRTSSFGKGGQGSLKKAPSFGKGGVRASSSFGKADAGSGVGKADSMESLDSNPSTNMSRNGSLRRKPNAVRGM